MRRFRPSVWVWCLAAALSLLSATETRAEESFYLKDGDRVVFYGDSITDQRLYTTFVETFVVTRFPKWNITFIHSGWGGDRVTGGGGGPIERRLKRDVFAYKPTVMTIMLGMNDASYRTFDTTIFETYTKGYESIVREVKANCPGIRMTLIEPSPFDDVTREPNMEGGYNAVLVRYGEFVKDLARKEGLDFADLNTPVVEATKKAYASDPENAKKLNPDRVHPGPSGQLLMAEALLKAWHAPSIVSKVTITVDKEKTNSEVSRTKLDDLQSSDGKLSWTQRDEALPFPVNLKDPLVDLAVRSSDVIEALDEQPLRVSGLPEGDYTLKIDGKDVGTFASAKLGEGVNLATLPTPMVKQAEAVHRLTLKHNDIHFTRWRNVQVPLESANAEKVKQATDALDDIERDVVKAQRDEAQPKSRTFELTRTP